MSNDGLGSNPQAGGFSLSAIVVGLTATPPFEVGSGYIAFDVPVIYHNTTASSIPVRLVRREGDNGNVTINVSASERFNEQDILVTTSQSVTFLEGEYVKDITFTLTDKVLNGECHVQLTINSGPILARFNEVNTVAIVDTGTIQSTGSVLTDPANDSIQSALAEGKVVYLRTGTWNEAGINEYDQQGPEGNSAAYCYVGTSNTVIRNYPGESPIMGTTLDWGNREPSGGAAGDPASVGKYAFYVSQCDYVHIYGLEFTDRMGIFVREWAVPPVQGVNDQFYCHFHSNHFHDIYGPDNTGAIRLDDALQSVVFNNKIHNIYDSRLTAETSNGIDAENRNMHSGIHGYRPRECYIYQNTFYSVGRGVYRKDPQRLGATYKSHAILRNLFYDMQLHAMEYNYAGVSLLYQDNGGLIAENINISHATQLSNLIKVDQHDGPASGHDFKIYNNVAIGGSDQYMTIRSTTDVQVWNNYSSVGGILIQSDGINPEGNEVIYMDYNGFLDGSTAKWSMDLYVAGQTVITGLANWQAANYASATTTVISTADDNSISGAPLFTDAANKDFTLQVGSPYIATGRYGDDIGAYRLGHEQIGATI